MGELLQTLLGHTLRRDIELVGKIAVKSLGDLLVERVVLGFSEKPGGGPEFGFGDPMRPAQTVTLAVPKAGGTPRQKKSRQRPRQEKDHIQRPVNRSAIKFFLGDAFSVIRGSDEPDVFGDKTHFFLDNRLDARVRGRRARR